MLDLTSVSCPEIGTRPRGEFRKTTARPLADTVDPATGTPAVSKRATQAWIDALELSERRKNAAGQAVIAEHDTCRGGGTEARTS